MQQSHPADWLGWSCNYPAVKLHIPPVIRDYRRLSKPTLDQALSSQRRDLISLGGQHTHVGYRLRWFASYAQISVGWTSRKNALLDNSAMAPTVRVLGADSTRSVNTSIWPADLIHCEHVERHSESLQEILLATRLSNHNDRPRRCNVSLMRLIRRKMGNKTVGGEQAVNKSSRHSINYIQS